MRRFVVSHGRQGGEYRPGSFRTVDIIGDEHILL